MALPAKHTSPNEILLMIKTLKSTKYSGHDHISDKIVKNLPLKFTILLTYMFIAIIRLPYIPATWKSAIIFKF